MPCMRDVVVSACCYCRACNLVCMHSRLARCDWLLKVALVLCNVAYGAASTSGSASIFEFGSSCQWELSGLPSTAHGSRCHRGKALQTPPQSLELVSQLRGGSIEEAEVVPGEAISPCCVQHAASMDQKCSSTEVHYNIIVVAHQCCNRMTRLLHETLYSRYTAKPHEAATDYRYLRRNDY